MRNNIFILLSKHLKIKMSNGFDLLKLRNQKKAQSEKLPEQMKESACNTGDPSLTPGSGRSPGQGIGYTLQCSWASGWRRWERIGV